MTDLAAETPGQAAEALRRLATYLQAERAFAQAEEEYRSAYQLPDFSAFVAARTRLQVARDALKLTNPDHILALATALVTPAPTGYLHPKFGHRAEILYRGAGVGGQRIVLARVWFRGEGEGSIQLHNEESFDFAFRPAAHPAGGPTEVQTDREEI